MIQSLNEMKTIEGRDLDPVIQRDTLLGGETATGNFGALSLEGLKNFFFNNIVFGGPISSIVAAAGDISNYGYILCDGREVLKTDYPELYAVIGGKFGETNTTFKVPKIDKFIEGTTDPTKIGQNVPAGIPNIEGYLDGPVDQGRAWIQTSNDNAYSGALSPHVTQPNVLHNISSDVREGLMGIKFSAAKGEVHNGTCRNDVYGKSDTVQPASILFSYYIKAKNQMYKI